MNGRDNQRSYLLNNQPGGRVIVPPRDHSHNAYMSNAPTSQQIPSGGTASKQGRTVSQSTATPGAPYNQTHLPTSNPSPQIDNNPTITFTAKPQVTQPTPTASPKPQAQPAPTNQNVAGTTAKSIDPTMAEAYRRYHTAWQNYYQKYYENYYIAALQEQQARFAKQQAEIVDSREDDGKLSQTEVQQRIKNDITTKLKQAATKSRKQWWFWPAIAAIVVILVFLFLQYNSVIAAKIASFVSPGSSSSQTIIVGTGVNQPVSDSPRIIIPKINVNAPVTYGLTDLSEGAVQTALQNGPINYPVTGATAVPGQKGNTVILGHSSADVFAAGDYKFIFVQLNRLAAGDLFYLDYGNTRYTYKVTETKVINPDEISALNLGTDKPYATLVTCDPPGTTAKRLLVIAEQVSPNPNQATDSPGSDITNTPSSITGKPKTLLENIFGG